MLSWQGGGIENLNSSSKAAAYEVEYRESIYREFSLSLDYLNEGHFNGHHRDGYAAEAWYKIPIIQRKPWVSLLLGVGPYYYFDTETLGSASSLDIHGQALMASARLQGYLGDNFFWMASANWVKPSTDFRSASALVGVGYWLGPEEKTRDNDPSQFGYFGEDARGFGKALDTNEVTLFGVLSVINVSSNPRSPGFAAEYRHRFFENLDGTVTYIYEGDPRVARRSGVTAELWPVRSGNRFLKNMDIAFGGGPYLFIDRRNHVKGQAGSAAAAGVVSAMVSFDLPGHLLWRFVWDRVVTTYDRDADIWRTGIGYRFGGP